MSKKTIFWLLMLLVAIGAFYFNWWRNRQMAAFYPSTPVVLAAAEVKCSAQGQVAVYTSPAVNPPEFVILALPDTTCITSYSIRYPNGDVTNVPHTNRRITYMAIPAPPANGTLTVNADCREAAASDNNCASGFRMWTSSSAAIAFNLIPLTVDACTFTPAEVTCNEPARELFYFDNKTSEVFSIVFKVRYTGDCEKIDLTCQDEGNNGVNISEVNDKGKPKDGRQTKSVRANDRRDYKIKILAGKTFRIMGDCTGDKTNCTAQLTDIRIFKEK